MKDIKYQIGGDIDFKQIVALYDNAGWTVYTSSPETLKQAIDDSLFVLSAWKGQQLAGFLRAVGDGLTIIYIQDLIVLDRYRRQGIGRELLSRTLEYYKNVRQILLLTDNKPDTIAFYESAGLKQTSELNLTSFIRFKP
jgi:ribosomal protein S18 acetylase RimI-like enzyme